MTETANNKYDNTCIDKVVSLEGKVFGLLKVKEYWDGAGAWLCECKCGKLVNRTGVELMFGLARDCGRECIYRKKEKNNSEEMAIEGDEK